MVGQCFLPEGKKLGAGFRGFEKKAFGKEIEALEKVFGLGGAEGEGHGLAFADFKYL